MDEGDSRCGASLGELYEGNLEGALITWDPGRYVEKVLEAGISIGAPLVNLEGGLYNGNVER